MAKSIDELAQDMQHDVRLTARMTTPEDRQAYLDSLPDVADKAATSDN